MVSEINSPFRLKYWFRKTLYIRDNRTQDVVLDIKFLCWKASLQGVELSVIGLVFLRILAG